MALFKSRLQMTSVLFIKFAHGLRLGLYSEQAETLAEVVKFGLWPKGQAHPTEVFKFWGWHLLMHTLW